MCLRACLLVRLLACVAAMCLSLLRNRSRAIELARACACTWQRLATEIPIRSITDRARSLTIARCCGRTHTHAAMQSAPVCTIDRSLARSRVAAHSCWRAIRNLTTIVQRSAFHTRTCMPTRPSHARRLRSSAASVPTPMTRCCRSGFRFRRSASRRRRSRSRFRSRSRRRSRRALPTPAAAFSTAIVRS